MTYKDTLRADSRYFELTPSDQGRIDYPAGVSNLSVLCTKAARRGQRILS